LIPARPVETGPTLQQTSPPRQWFSPSARALISGLVSCAANELAVSTFNIHLGSGVVISTALLGSALHLFGDFMVANGQMWWPT